MRLLVIFVLLFNCAFGQNTNFLALGYDCCTGSFSGMNMDFSTGSLQISTTQRHFNFSRTNGQIWDDNGTLLIATNGVYIGNALDDTMQNGSGLNPSLYTTNYALRGLGLIQANIIVPLPDDSTKYYLFHLTSDDYGNTNASFYLYYSFIDMSLNNGLGAVIQKNIVLLNDTLVPGGLSACKHANGRDWWLVGHEAFNFNEYKFLITPFGITGPFFQDLSVYRGLGQTVFSQEGNKVAMYEGSDTDLDIWDFDRCTGDFFNHIHIAIDDSALASGVAFSPSGRFLYVSSMNYVYQYDLWAASIDSSRIKVGVYDGFISWAPAIFSHAGLAADGKIYISTGNGTMVMHVINFPDSAGTACGFCQHCVQLPAFYFETIPNYPNYKLGALNGSSCDSLHIDVPFISTSVPSFQLFPNPVLNNLYVTQNTSELLTGFSVFNSLGERLNVVSENISNGSYLQLDVSSLSAGVYYIEMLSGKQKVVKRFVKE